MDEQKNDNLRLELLLAVNNLPIERQWWTLGYAECVRDMHGTQK